MFVVQIFQNKPVFIIYQYYLLPILSLLSLLLERLLHSQNQKRSPIDGQRRRFLAATFLRRLWTIHVGAGLALAGRRLSFRSTAKHFDAHSTGGFTLTASSFTSNTSPERIHFSFWMLQTFSNKQLQSPAPRDADTAELELCVFVFVGISQNTRKSHCVCSSLWCCTFRLIGELHFIWRRAELCN